VFFSDGGDRLPKHVALKFIYISYIFVICENCWFLIGSRISWGKFSQKQNYKYMAKWWCLLEMENCMFRPIAAIIRFWPFSCYKSYI